MWGAAAVAAGQQLLGCWCNRRCSACGPVLRSKKPQKHQQGASCKTLSPGRALYPPLPGFEPLTQHTHPPSDAAAAGQPRMLCLWPRPVNKKPQKGPQTARRQLQNPNRKTNPGRTPNPKNHGRTPHPENPGRALYPAPIKPAHTQQHPPAASPPAHATLLYCTGRSICWPGRCVGCRPPHQTP